LPDAHLPNSPTLTTHIENGVLYRFDVRLCMFASGNGTERMHFATIRAPGERVVDMFAGIGYFALPLALHGGVERVVCLEKNRDSAAFLRAERACSTASRRASRCCAATTARSAASTSARATASRWATCRRRLSL
jgi:16S rRNA G966 N2-methylase RsmD